MTLNEFGQRVGESSSFTGASEPAPLILRGQWSALEPVSDAHAESLFESLCGPANADLWTYRPDQAPVSVAECAARYRAIAAPTWAIVHHEAGRALGLLSLLAVNRDTDWFSLTDGEWPTRRTAFAAWLHPANFDPLGRELAPLERTL